MVLEMKHVPPDNLYVFEPIFKVALLEDPEAPAPVVWSRSPPVIAPIATSVARRFLIRLMKCRAFRVAYAMA